MNDLPFLIRLVAATIVARQNQMLVAENALKSVELAKWRDDFPNHRFRFTDEWRAKLARTGAAVGWERLAQISTVAKVATIRGWHRLMQKGQLGAKRAKTGRPRTDAAIEHVVVRMATENPTWGQLRIAGMLCMCMIAISPRNIAAILARHGLKPAPERTTDWSWKRFITEKADKLVATDFFTVDVWSWMGKQSYDVLFAIHLSTRHVEILGVTQHANSAFMAQVARNLTSDDGWLRKVGCKYLIHDRDTKFCGRWKDILGSAGIELTPTPPRSPNMNAFAERWVRTVKDECLDQLILFGERSLRHALDEDLAHHQHERNHQGLDNVIPFSSEQSSCKEGTIRKSERLGGLPNFYQRAA